MMKDSGRYGVLLEQHLKEERPKLYKEWKDSGYLEEFLYKRAIKAYDQLSNLMKSGLNPIEAEEMIWGELMTLPEEEESI